MTNDLIDKVIEQVLWWYQIGRIDVIDREAIAEAIDEVCPDEAVDWDIGAIMMAMA